MVEGGWGGKLQIADFLKAIKCVLLNLWIVDSKGVEILNLKKFKSHLSLKDMPKNDLFLIKNYHPLLCKWHILNCILRSKGWGTKDNASHRQQLRKWESSYSTK